MRIVFVSSMAGSPWGGSEELWSQAALRLKQSGHAVSASVVGGPKLSGKITDLQEQGISIALQAHPNARFPVRLWRKVTKRCGLMDPDVAWLRHKRPDLVVVSQGYNQDGLEWMKRCRECRLPYVSVVQCNSEIWWPADDTGNQLATAYRDAKRVFCVSHHNRSLLEFQIGEALPNAEVVWNPFNVPAGQPPAWPEESGVWKLACVARLDPAAKGQDILLQVMAQRRWRERPVELNLYGTGPCENNLRRMIGRLGLSNVHLRGHVTEVQTIWERNHLLVLPSRYEGLPLALVEAMWSARPALVTDVGGTAEMCVDGETGFVADAPTSQALEETLERAWDHRWQWSALGQAARRRVNRIMPHDPVGQFCRKLIALTN
jgi:glycosyltransferase involved in cell wall biosynthesis